VRKIRKQFPDDQSVYTLFDSQFFSTIDIVPAPEAELAQSSQRPSRII
jgi:hypothetical protein